MTELEKKALAEQIIVCLKNEFRETPYYNQVEEDGSVSLVEKDYFYRLQNKIINDCLND